MKISWLYVWPVRRSQISSAGEQLQVLYGAGGECSQLGYLVNYSHAWYSNDHGYFRTAASTTENDFGACHTRSVSYERHTTDYVSDHCFTHV